MIQTFAHRFLASRTTATYFLLVWTVSIISSFWWLTPGDDDGYYTHQIFSFVNFGTIGLFHIETFYKTFIGFPGYPTVQGFFFTLWDAIGLPINIYTYKSFQVLVMVVLVALTSRLVFEITEDEHKGAINDERMVGLAWARISVLLLALGISPFMIDTLYLRPEPAGLLSIVLAMLAFRRCQNGPRWRGVWAALAGFFVGASATMHPTFVIGGGILGLFMAGHFLRRRKYLYTALGTGFALLPITAAASWFIANGEYALNALLGHFLVRAPRFGGAIQNFISAMMEPLTNLSLATLYFSVPYLILSVLIILVTVLMAWRFLRPPLPPAWPHGGKAIGAVTVVDAFFLGVLLNFVMDGAGRIQIITVLGFAASLALATALRARSDTPASAISSNGRILAT